MRLAAIVGSAVVALLLLGTAGMVLAFPFGAAAACPSCYGLIERVSNGTSFLEAYSAQN